MEWGQEKLLQVQYAQLYPNTAPPSAPFWSTIVIGDGNLTCLPLFDAWACYIPLHVSGTILLYALILGLGIVPLDLSTRIIQ